MHCVYSCGIFVFWFLQVILAMYQIQVPELEFLSDKLGPMECVRFYKLLQRKMPEFRENQTPQQEPYGSRGSPNCKKLLTSWLKDPKGPIDKARERVELTLRQIGRADLARWLGYNVIHHRQLANSEKECQHDIRGNMAVRYKGEDHLVRGSPPEKLTSDETSAATTQTQTVLQKVVITVVVIVSMTTLCLCCYKFLYARMRGGHFTNFRYKFVEPRRFDDRVKNEFDEESWLQQDHRESGGGSGSCCTAALADTTKSWWNSVDSLKRKPFSAVEYLKNKFRGRSDCCRDKRSRQFRLLITRLQKICPTQRKIIHLSRKEQNLLKSLTDFEKHQLPATDSDLKFLVASDREKRKLLAREGRREFFIELRKKLERIGPDDNRNISLNETERKFLVRLSSSERLLLPIMDKDLELLATSPLQKRQVMLRQMACKFAGISPDDRKYLELDVREKKFLKEIDDKEKKKLDVTDSEFRFLVASRSQKNVMQQRLDSFDRDQRIKDIRKKLAEVNYDVSRLLLSKIEHSSFLSLSCYELAQLGLTKEHLKFYAASESERKVMWPSPSQHRNLRINTLQTKLSKLPWKERGTRLTSSEHTLLASLTPREQDKLHISDSEKNFMLSTDSEKELIQRQRNIERLEAKIRDFNTVTMTESERGLILSLSPSEMQMLNIDSTNKSSLLEKRSERRCGRRDAMVREAEMRSLSEKIDRDLNAELTEADQALLSSLNASEMATMRLSASQIRLMLSNASGNNERRRIMRMKMIKDRIQREGLSDVRLTNSERGLVETLSNFEIDSCGVTPSELSFLLAEESDRRTMEHREWNGGHQTAGQCTGSATRQCASARNMHVNNSSHVCHEQTVNNVSNFDRHARSHCSGHSVANETNNQSNHQEFRHKVQFKEPEAYEDRDEGRVFLRESDDSEISETYDELGMLFSQQMKQQARPCHRKYCLLGRHLRKGNRQHDEKQCQTRHYCCRSYPSDQRPSCSSGNVCKDTYDEFQLMHARPHEKRMLNSSMFERRKQFLDQPCHKYSTTHHNCMKTN